MLKYDNGFAYVYWVSYMILPCSHLPLISPNAENVIVCLLNALQPHTIYTDFSHVNLTGVQDLHSLYSVLLLDPLPLVPLGPVLSSPLDPLLLVPLGPVLSSRSSASCTTRTCTLL